MTTLLFLLLPLIVTALAVLIWLRPTEDLPPGSVPGDYPTPAAAERDRLKIARDWRAIVQARRERRRELAEAERQRNWLVVRRNFPLWLADLGDRCNARTYDSCYELARFTCLALIYADHHLKGRFSVRAMYRNAADIEPVKNSCLHSREFFEALGKALEEQELLTSNQGNRGRRVQSGALERLARQLPAAITHEMIEL